MTFKQFLEDNKRYIDVSKSEETSMNYVLTLKEDYLFVVWTPNRIPSVKTTKIRKTDWNNGMAGKLLMEGFYEVDKNDKIKSITGIVGKTNSTYAEFAFVQDNYFFIKPTAVAGLGVNYLAWAYQLDLIDAYDPKVRKAGQKTDKGGEQRPAGIGATKGKVSTFVYIVREIKRISEKSGLPIYGKLKEVSVRRVDQKSADNYVKSMYSYKKTGKLYFVELKSIK
jgi:hypothetical protein